MANNAHCPDTLEYLHLKLIDKKGILKKQLISNDAYYVSVSIEQKRLLQYSRDIHKHTLYLNQPYNIPIRNILIYYMAKLKQRIKFNYRQNIISTIQRSPDYIRYLNNLKRYFMNHFMIYDFQDLDNGIYLI